ncbi:hypothetical protein KAFR_0E02540 [Kazachstania africana CBS 2517]|uniref:UBA domain-containing protein n=1 Tax=Kazachstania africana (strain ATCC 22294 / BCRC 22015 / CBS 2517 / CECT 1963 / NBRC 1671 / NRRL Y-8276) TaxID=1071382 RepID=H2AVK7_KAZAF|nr:hypothetical protein KAFR_0E02540 [Kazachstania africana CBS 2517]CCF58407.1 hypothetical protein KAFR_0E02540 [Kazachstania africana CBS 2517]
MNGEESSLNSLLEMGISKNVAIDALQKFDGNLEAAINYIFSNDMSMESIQTHPQPNNNPFLEEHTVELSDSKFKPGDLDTVITPRAGGDEKDLIQLSSSDEEEGSLQNPDQTVAGETEKVNIPIDSQSSSYSSFSTSLSNENELRMSENTYNNPPEYSTVQHSERKSDIADPTIVLPLPPNSLIENYLALYALSIANFFAIDFLKPDFKDLNYRKEWYRSSSIDEPFYRVKFNKADETENEIVPAAELTETDHPQPKLLWQLQKLIAVVNSDLSERAYVSAKIFNSSSNQQLQSKLGDAEHLNEVLPYFIKALAVDLESCYGDKSSDIKKLFISSAFYKPSQNEPLQETYLSFFHFLPEEYDTNLYKMFNVLLIPDEDDEESGESDEDQPDNSLNIISPFLTIVFNEMDESTDDNMTTSASFQGVDIPFEFYPQLYTKKCKDELIKHILSKRKESKSKLKVILQEINALKSYHGKDILMFLNSTIDFLQKDSNAESTDHLEVAQELNDLRAQINGRKAGLKDEYKELSQKLHNEWNLSYPDLHIIQTAKTLGLIDTPYLLTTVVISPYFYFMRDRKKVDQWCLVQSNGLGTDFHITNFLDKENVSTTIKQYTKVPNESPLMFIYCKENYIASQDDIWKLIEENEGCSSFIKADQLHLTS